ncbi:hypothetical protein NLI96_g4680 [Meripilus lineatus]|uniref:Cullin family profile domain-containing protein n=1 Tax=Meripilus lineatus TaxID=2056292 RepID=A0AAD5V479_9APHY|nr:hypothetical protein NLI96_g4680 [Physisporinus lineatus]
MTDVFTLLSFPKSRAFSSYGSPYIEVSTQESHSPPRKTPRLDRDLDSASASRSRGHVIKQEDESAGPIVITISGLQSTSIGQIPAKFDPFIPSCLVHSQATHVYDKEFALVKRSIRLLLTNNSHEKLPGTYERIFNACRTVVSVAQKGEGLYENLKIEVERCNNELARVLKGDTRNGVEWLVALVEASEWYEKRVNILESLLAYLDRGYMHEKVDLSSIRTLCYSQFSLQIFGNSDIAQKIRAGIDDWIIWERKNRAVHAHREVLPKFIARLQHHGQYDEIFESYLVSVTFDFYSSESTDLSKSLTAQDFLLHCEGRRNEEIRRAKDVMPRSSWLVIQGTTDRALLSGRLEWLVKDGKFCTSDALGVAIDFRLVFTALAPLIEQRKEKELERMYQLFVTVDGKKVLLEGFKLCIQGTTRKIVTDVDQDDQMVERLLEFKAFAERLVADAFATPKSPRNTANVDQEDIRDAMIVDTPPIVKKPNKDFKYALSDAFQRGFRSRRNKPAELLAKHLDKALRKGQQGKKDADFEKELDAVLGLYRFTEDKDVFRTFYHRALAKRLLLEKSASDDIEKSLLKKLKELYDSEFGMGDHMFNDLALSRDTMRDYNEHRQRLGDAPESQNLTAMVLQRSFWPFAARTHVAGLLPPNMETELLKYTAFYKGKHQGHKLDWYHSLGTATLRARFDTGAKELSVSLHQAAVLLLFNNEMDISFKDIKNAIPLEDSELRRTLQSLACGKKRVLKKQPVGKNVNDGDVFSFNSDFTDPGYRVHINSIQVKETPEESKKTQSLIESDRKHVLDAAIVRIMKARKEMKNEDLKTATIDAVKNHFVPDVEMIKQRIGELVDQEYIKRSETDMNTFLYVA